MPAGNKNDDNRHDEDIDKTDFTTKLIFFELRV